jgi:two-component system, OmpR family, sensor kinase
MVELPAPRRKRRAAVRSARLRVLGWILVLLGLTLAGTAAVAYVRLDAHARGEADSELAHQVDEFRLAAARAAASGHQPADVRELLVSAQRVQLPHEHQVLLTFIDGRPLRPLPESIRDLARDRTFRAHLSTGGRPLYDDAQVAAGHVRYVALPVMVASDSARGTFVVVTFLDRHRELAISELRTHALLGMGALALATSVGWLVTGHLVAPLRLLRTTAGSISQSDLRHRIPVEGDDEITELARTFNGMLDRLEAAFASQRRLLDEVGHELRTPITIVRGQVEVLGDTPDADTQMVAVVTDELDRMARMVEELVTLAKAERPDFLRLEPIELSEFVDEVFAKFCALVPDRIQLIAPDPSPSYYLLGDRQRLTQALVQLADNAVRHTPPDSQIWLGARAQANAVRVWVRDDGPGIPPDQQRVIFDRFARPPAGGHARGSGLGLPVVAAIARAHSGQVLLRSSPGAGAEFALELPNTPNRSGPGGRNFPAARASGEQERTG